MKKVQIIQSAIAGLLLLAVGCGQSSAPAPSASAEPSVPDALAAVFQDVAATESIQPIPELRTSVSPGDTVVVEAKVMGDMNPFVENRALFVVGDEGTLTSCDLRGDDDHCDTPWDNCCDDPKALRAGTATIQVVDANGQVIKHSIRGLEGLKELSRIRVKGVVAPQATEGALIINATAIDVL